MESSNAEIVVEEPGPEVADKADRPVLIMVESGDDGGVCDADGTCY
jgi:hypothetical protein